jgi:uncharacterized protein
MPLYPGVSIITLGVADVATASRFYQRLGWRLSTGASSESISFFSLNNIVLAVFGADHLFSDSGLTRAPSTTGATEAAQPKYNQALSSQAQSNQALPGQARIVLAQNYPSEMAVRQAMNEAQEAGARILVQPTSTFWGGFHGVFADPDGHVWELAHNQFFPLAPDGSVELPN